MSILDAPEFTTPKGGAAPLDPENFVVKRVEVGPNKVPLTLLYKKSIDLDGSNPTIMHVLGANGKNVELGFDISMANLAERGWVVAYTHVRGGGEKGHQWHVEGSGTSKMNSMNDFVECANYLIDQKYTNSSVLCAKSYHEGGPILGYVANNHPNLFATLIFKEPFLDLTSSFLDNTRFFLADEVKEWGDIQNKEEYDVINSYDPYINVSRHEYPNMLVCGSPFEYRYQLHQQMKYVAKVRANKTNNPIILFDSGVSVSTKPEGERPFIDAAQDLGFLYSTLNLFPTKFGAK